MKSKIEKKIPPVNMTFFLSSIENNYYGCISVRK